MNKLSATFSRLFADRFFSAPNSSSFFKELKKPIFSKMTSERQASTQADGHPDYSVVLIQQKQHDDVKDFIRQYFTPRETFMTKCGVSTKEVSCFMDSLCDDCLSFKASAAVIHEPTQEIAGVCLTKFLDNSKDEGFGQTEIGSEKEENMKKMLCEIESRVDIFADSTINKALEVVCIGSKPQFSGKGVVYMMMKKCDEIGRDFGCQLSYAQCTGPASFHVFEKWGYECREKVFYHTLQLDGKPLHDPDLEDKPFIGLMVKDFRES